MIFLESKTNSRYVTTDWMMITLPFILKCIDFWWGEQLIKIIDQARAADCADERSLPRIISSRCQCVFPWSVRDITSSRCLTPELQTTDRYGHRQISARDVHPTWAIRNTAPICYDQRKRLELYPSASIPFLAFSSSNSTIQVVPSVLPHGSWWVWCITRMEALARMRIEKDDNLGLSFVRVRSPSLCCSRWVLRCACSLPHRSRALHFASDNAHVSHQPPSNTQPLSV